MNDKELKELEAIKRLLVFQLLNAGVRGAEIAEILEMKQSNFSRDFKARRLIKRLKKGIENAEEE